MNRYLLTAFLILGTLGSALAQKLPASVSKKLDNDIRYLVGQNRALGSFAVAVVDRNGVISQVNGGKAYPLASVFKLPLLLALLDGQDKGTFPSLGTSLTIGRSDQCIGSGRLADRGLGTKVSVEKACQLMMSISDNTATDLLFRRYGVKMLDPWLAKAGYKSSEIILTNRQAWLLSLGKVPGWGRTTPEARVQKWAKLNRAQRLELGQKIERSASNLSLAQFQAIEDASTGTQSAYQDNLLAARLDNKMSALDLAKLLISLDSGDLLSAQSRGKAFQIIGGQKYHTRLPKSLSPGTDIYHKTGTLSGVRNDAGLMFTKNRDHGVAVVFLSQSVTPGSGRRVDALAAKIAKLVEKAYSQN